MFVVLTDRQAIVKKEIPLINAKLFDNLTCGSQFTEDQRTKTYTVYHPQVLYELAPNKMADIAF